MGEDCLLWQYDMGLYFIITNYIITYHHIYFTQLIMAHNYYHWIIIIALHLYDHIALLGYDWFLFTLQIIIWGQLKLDSCFGLHNASHCPGINISALLLLGWDLSISLFYSCTCWLRWSGFRNSSTIKKWDFSY